MARYQQLPPVRAAIVQLYTAQIFMIAHLERDDFLLHNGRNLFFSP